MAGLVELATPSVDAQPGEESEVGVLVYNTGIQDEAYDLEVTGSVAPWAFLDPAVVRLQAGDSRQVRLVLRPPRGTEVPAGPTPFAIRLVARADPSAEEVAEGTIDIIAFEAFTARLVPDVLDAAARGRAKVIIDNEGNIPIVVRLTAASPDGAVGLKLDDETVMVPAGTTASVLLVLKPRHRRLLGKGAAALYTVRLESLLRVATLSGRVRPKGSLPMVVLRSALAGAAFAGAVLGVRSLLGDGGRGAGRVTSKGLPARIIVTTVPGIAPAAAGIRGVPVEPPPAVATTVAPVPGGPVVTVASPPAGQTNSTLPAPPADVRGTGTAVVLHRLFDPALSDYVYTADPAEQARLSQQGFLDQGSVGKVLTARSQGTVPLYRLRKPDGRHIFTFDEGERRTAVVAGAAQEGIAGYLYPSPAGGTQPVYRMSKDGVAYLTVDQGDVNARQANGWVNEGVRGYVVL